MFALGVTMYGQMTAGSYCYIGPQGIVHGTTVKLNMLTDDRMIFVKVYSYYILITLAQQCKLCSN